MPLADTLRPTKLSDVVGQDKTVSLLSSVIDKLPSFILWGPPGVGKTTIAKAIATQTSRPFFSLHAVHSGVKEVREVIDKAAYARGSILFIDEIHRFNKTQQDALLAAVEKGIVTLIGATTENPSFSVVSALLSRCQVYQLYSLEVADLQKIVERAQAYFATQGKTVQVVETKALFAASGGDARKLLNLIELLSSEPITDARVAAIGGASTRYDWDGEQHYDAISAFIKSMRGSDPDAALYWLSRMIHGGEDPRFLVRRMIIFASEDIGNANPTALVLATSALTAVENIGMPEARIILGQVAAYLASSPKSNAAYLAIDAALAAADADVPYHLRNAPTKLMKDLGYGVLYKYPHDFAGHFVVQSYMPESLASARFYRPTSIGQENRIRERLEGWWGSRFASDTK
ncbi:MAG TPA: replication-associated recombination protein A [Acidobacteriota bacterium]|nr:replication-associated recombination protein A [Acidobacteriota bacterium]